MLSRTAYNLIKDSIKNKSDEPNVFMLALKGKSYEYPVYEFWPGMIARILKKVD